jgi:cholesterol transport system auxiliary component
MIRRRGSIARRSLAGGTVLALAGCAGLFAPSPPSHLYRLTANGRGAPGLPRVAAQLLIDQPQAPAGLDTSRIALSRSPLSLDYYADSQWTDRVPDLVQDLLVAAFENSGAIAAVDRTAAGVRGDFILATEIRHFEAVYDSASGPPQARVTLIARLVSVPRRAVIAQARFERRVRAAGAAVSDVVTAFEAATDAVLRDIVTWTLGNPALSQARR